MSTSRQNTSSSSRARGQGGRGAGRGHHGSHNQNDSIEDIVSYFFTYIQSYGVEINIDKMQKHYLLLF